MGGQAGSEPSAPVISPSRCSGHSPMNLVVMCMLDGRLQLIRAVGLSFSSNASRLARTSGGMSMAVNSRISFELYDRETMRQIPGWDEYYLDICKVVANRSKDVNTQIGCVVVGPNHEIRSTGYNSFPRGIRDDVPERMERPTKYLWIEHAERNAICNAARAGTATEGCTIYVEIMPCMDCARAIVQAGITEVVVSAVRMSQYSSEYYNQHFSMVEVLFSEAKVKVRRV
jgi:dCMP deaminase